MRQRIHLAGIGGVGMSALAQTLLDAGMAVSGSDRLLDRGDETDVLARLRGQGVRLFPQDGSGVDAEVARVVVSTAVEADNPDLEAAARRGVPVVHRAAELADRLAGRRLIAVTGTCGKSSVTAMLGWLLAETGLDPLVVNGASVVGWDAGGRIGSVRNGAGEWAVIEADESDRSLMGFRPEHAIITNVSADHFNLDETQRVFAAFRGRVSGAVIDDEPGHPEGMRAEGWHGRFVFEGVAFDVPLPGRHNILNAWQAVRMGHVLGVPVPTLARGLATFPGVERRLQRVGACDGAEVVDDYAHNPAKIEAAWETLAAVFPRVVGVWRPHGYAPLRNMLTALAETFSRVVRPADRLLLLPVYDAGGSADRSIGTSDLLARLAAHGVPAEAVAGLGGAEAALRACATPGTVLLTFGARDPGLPRLAHRLTETATSR